jgi:peroxiredoxin (alkyl hydroperoxide reductase subunit C)
MPLDIGRPAPDFTLKDQHGQDVSLTDFRGEKNLVLVFYPFAFSRVCTGELCELRDQIADFSDDRTALVAVSCDHMFSQRAFAERDGYSFPLLSDFWPHGAVSSAYGIFNEKAGCSGRATFIVDRDGVLRWMVENEIPQARDVEDYRKILADLG